MAWRKNDPNFTNDPTYLEPRINALEEKVDTIEGSIGDSVTQEDLETAVDAVVQVIDEHKQDSTPHWFTASDNRKYKYGLKTNAAKDGIVFIYEEVL